MMRTLLVAFLVALVLAPASALAADPRALLSGDTIDHRLLGLARTCALTISETATLVARAEPPHGAEEDHTFWLRSSGGPPVPAREEVAATTTAAAQTPLQAARERRAQVADEVLEATDAEINIFLKRETLGFDLSTFAWVRERIVDTAQALRDAVEDFASAGFVDKLRMSAPLQLVLMILMAFVALDRRARSLRREVWDMLPLSRPLLDAVLDSTLRVLARTLPVAVLLVPVYFPLHGLFPDALWLAVTTRVLWLMLLYRAAFSIGSELLLGEALALEPRPVRLAAWWRFGLRVGLALWLGHDLVELLGGRHDVAALLGFSFKVFVGFHVLRLFALRDELVLLVPDLPESGLYSAVRRFLVNYVHLVIGLSILLIVLWAAGFSTAATFLLIRSYSFIGLVLVSLWVYRRAQTALHRMVQRQETPEGDPIDVERHRVLRSLERSVLFVGSLLMGWAMLSLLGVWPLLVRLSSIPLVELGDPGLVISVFVVARASLVFVVFMLLSRIVRAVLNEKVYPRFEVELGVGYAINTTLHYCLFLFGIFLALGSLGLDLSGIAIFASALGIGIGFGLQDIVKNLISGLILLFGRSVKKGDFVTVSDRFGRVDAVGARSVTITTPDNFELVIPSSELTSRSLINWTLTSPYVRVTVPVVVHYDSDIHRVREILIEAALRHPRVLKKPAPEAWLERFGNSNLEFGLLVYVDLRRTNQRRIIGELNYHVWDVLKEHQVEVPHPQRDLHLRSIDPELHALVTARAPWPPHPDPDPPQEESPRQKPATLPRARKT